MLFQRSSESIAKIQYNCMDDAPIQLQPKHTSGLESVDRHYKGCPLCYWLGVVLREYRERAGLSMADLASKAKLSEPGLACMERNLRRPSVWAMRRICRALGISVGQVIVEAEMRAFQAGDDSEPLLA